VTRPLANDTPAVVTFERDGGWYAEPVKSLFPAHVAFARTRREALRRLRALEHRMGYRHAY
jgi:hypothetical protein